MDINFALVIFVGISCMFTIFRAIQDPFTNSRGWIPISIIVLLVVIIAFFWLPRQSGYISLVLWLLFGIIPTIVFRRVQTLLVQQKFTQIRSISKFIRWFHPFANWRQLDEIYLAHELTLNGRYEEAKDILNKYENSQSLESLKIKYQILALMGEWDRIRKLLEKEMEKKTFKYDASDLVNYLRSLGETFEIDKMLIFYDKYRQVFEKVHQSNQIARLFIFGFCGCPEYVDFLFEDKSFKLLPHTQSLWRATAKLYGDAEIEGKLELEKLLEVEDEVLRNTIRRRLTHSFVNSRKYLSHESNQILNQIKEDTQKAVLFANLKI